MVCIVVIGCLFVIKGYPKANPRPNQDNFQGQAEDIFGVHLQRAVLCRNAMARAPLESNWEPRDPSFPGNPIGIPKGYVKPF